MMDTPADSERRLFGDALACTLTVPVVLCAGSGAQTGQDLARTAEALLRNIAQVEDNQPEEKPDEHGTRELALQRLEAKLDLLLGVIGQFFGRDSAADLPRVLRWSHLGFNVVLPGNWQPGNTALLCMPAADWLPQQLVLPVRVLACEPAGDDGLRLWLAVEPLGEGLAEAIKRHLFRLHRRAIAEERRSR